MNIAMLGFGEAARALVAGWRASAAFDGTGAVSGYDIKYDDAAQRPALLEACRGLAVDCAGTLAEALQGRTAVFSLVTADCALEAAENAATVIERDSWYFDGNSCSPGTKKKAAGLIAAAGGRYIDVAIMAPVHPRLHRTPLLLAGSDVAEAHGLLRGLDMNVEVAGSTIGQASSIKMLRSVRHCPYAVTPSGWTEPSAAALHSEFWEPLPAASR